MLKQITALLIPLLVLVLLTHEIVVSTVTGQRKMAEQHQQAVELARDGQYSEAAAILDRLTRLQAHKQQYWVDYTTTLVWAGEYNKALALKHTLDLDQTPVYVLRALFDAAVETDQRSIAVDMLRRAQRHEDVTADKVARDYYRLLRAGYHREIADNAEPALTRFPENAKLRLVVAIAEARLDGGEVPEDLPRISEEEPRELADGLLAAVEDRPELSEIGLRMLRNLYPGDAYVLERNLLLDARLKRHADVAEQYRQYRELTGSLPGEEALRAAAEAFVAVEDYASAREVYEALLERHPDSREYRTALIDLLKRPGNEEELLAVLKPLVEAGDVDAQMTRVAAYERMGETARAADALETLMRAGHTDAQTYRRWFDNRIAAIGEEGYRPHRQSLAEWLPGNAPSGVISDYVGLLVRHRDFPRLEELAENENYRRRMLPLLERRAVALRQNQRYAAAAGLYRYALSLDSDALQLRLGLALSKSGAGEVEEADKLFAGLLEEYPDNRQVLDAAVYHYRRTGQDPALLNLLDKLVVAYPAENAYLVSWVETLLGGEAVTDPHRRLAYLDDMQERRPQSDLLRSHRLFLLAETGQCRRLPEEAPRLDWSKLDREELERTAFAARSCGEYELAARAYRLGLERHPQEAVFAAGLILALSEQGKTDEARRLVEEFSGQYGDRAQFLRAAAYAMKGAGDYRAAVSFYDRLLEKKPGDRRAYVERAIAANLAGDHELAFEYLREKPSWFDVADKQRLYADRATLAVRRLDAGEGRPATALEHLDTYEAFMRDAWPADTSALQTVQFDRMFAMNAVGRHERVAGVFSDMDMEKGELPLYALLALAESQLIRQRPEAALATLEKAERKDADDTRVVSLQFYAYLDSECYDCATERLKRLDALVGPESELPPGHWLRRLHAMFAAFGNRLGPAQRQLEAQRAEADTADLRLNLATVYRWRGWPRRSLDLYRSLETPEARVGEARALMDLHRYAEVKRIAEDLERDHPGNASVQGLLEDWKIHNRREFDTRFSRGDSDGVTFASQDFVLESHLYTEPVTPNDRFFGRQYEAWADVPEGTARMSRVGVGWQHWSDPVDWTVELSQSLRGDSDSGVTMTADWRIDDAWSVATELQSYSLDVPLRGIRAGIDGQSGALSVQYRRHESQRLRLAYKAVDFSDGNFRQSLFASHYHRLFRDEHHGIALTEHLYTSRNSERVTSPYFNPERDYSAGIAVEYEGIIRRRYDREWSHRLTTGIGGYKQKEFSSAAIWDIDYEHRWQFSESLSFRLGLLYRRRNYDGDDEDYKAVHGGLNWRF